MRTSLLPRSHSQRPQLVERRKCLGCCVIITIIVLFLLVLALIFGLVFGLTSSSNLHVGVTKTRLMQHLTELNNKTKQIGSRSVLTGYNTSAEYVEETLSANGYYVTKEYFSVGVYENLQPEDSVFRVILSVEETNYAWDFLLDTEYSVMRYSGNTGSSTLQGPLFLVSGGDYGCSETDFNGFPNGSIAIVNYSIPENVANCTFYDKARNAETSGAVAVVMGRSEAESKLGPPASRIYVQRPSGYSTVKIPVLGATYALMEKLQQLMNQGDENTIAEVRTYTSVKNATTYNLFAETPAELSNSTIVVGSHLDSVPAGLGINDNGSGSIANLLLALLFKKHNKMNNRLRFAFWGAEELGLLGSKHHIMNLSPKNKSAIVLNINLDMLGSPNYVRGIYNGSSVLNNKLLNGCRKIERSLTGYFRDRDIKYRLWPLSGGSDYFSFVQEGVDIPAGGVATGAGALKTEEERAKFKGFANAQLDTCYHQACDTIDNVDWDVYVEMTRAVANALEDLVARENLRQYINS